MAQRIEVSPNTEFHGARRYHQLQHSAAFCVLASKKKTTEN